VTGLTGPGRFTFAPNAPTSPSPGDTWFDSTTGAFSMWVDAATDGGTAQWVQYSPAAQGATGPAGPEPDPGLIPPPFYPLPLELPEELRFQLKLTGLY
jgi:hypothetical protein